MVDIVSIVIAVVSLLGSLVAAGFTGWVSFYIDQVKQRAESKALVHKYRDPLMLAAFDLQSRIYGITEYGLLSYAHVEEKRDLLYVYTAYLFGQYLSWVYILRRQAQFLRFTSDKTNNQLSIILDNIQDELSTDKRKGEGPFALWRGQQMAIGELMTLEEDGQLYCMGFAAFSKKYSQEPDFSKWFAPIEAGVGQLVHAREREDSVADNRLRRLQHQLVDLILVLDKERVAWWEDRKLKVEAAHGCDCSNCPRPTVAPPPSAPTNKSLKSSPPGP